MVVDPSAGSAETIGGGMVAGDVAGNTEVTGGGAPRVEVAVEEITTGRVKDSEEDTIAAEESTVRRAPAAAEDYGDGAELG
jgi:hypothetical protein